MKASEVLQRYAEGRRDFRGENLRCLSFKGKDLSGADFSEADISGTDFSKANLTGAKFVGAKAGLPKRWVITLLFACVVLLQIFSFWPYITAIMRGLSSYINSGLEAVVLGWLANLLILGFSFLSIYRGINSIAITFTITFGFASAFAFASGIASSFTINFANSFISASLVAITFAFTIATAFSFAFIFTLLYSYTDRRAIKGDPRYAWIRTIAIAFAAIGGTSFCDANLTDSDFTKATLKNTDFRDAILTRTCFKLTKNLNFARPGKTYLNIPQVREVLITGQGQDKDFSSLNLQGIHLQGANLADANFINTDLSNANLQDADLSRAKLVQTQLDKTDFTGATLTGAYIEDWGITRGTKFDGVRCEYVYMRLPTKYNPDPFRKPDNHQEVFADGEFGDFIKPIVDTLDLYHNQNVDPRAIAIAFKQLAENHPEAELEIVAIEKRGAGNVLLRAATSASANRSELSSEYFDNYNEIKTLNQELKARLAEKDNRIISLESMVITALQRPKFYAENYYNQGDTMPDNKGDIYNQSGNFGIGHQSGGTIEQGAKVAGVINEAEQRNLAETAAEIQQLLEQLDKSYSTDTTAGKMTIATEAIKQIESNPTLMKRILSAAKAGSISALESAINHPAASFVIGAIEDWQNS